MNINPFANILAKTLYYPQYSTLRAGLEIFTSIKGSKGNYRLKISSVSDPN